MLAELWLGSVLIGWFLAGFGIYAAEIESRPMLVFWCLALVLNVSGFIYFITYENL